MTKQHLIVAAWSLWTAALACALPYVVFWT
jgi:hypothetical protein